MEILYSFFTNSLLYIYQLLGNNFGWAIIVFTILIRLVTYPINKQQMDSAKAMQDLQNDPKWQKTQKKYKNDREKLAQEQMKIYQEKGINPFGSCLPTLIQFPIIIGLYRGIASALAATPKQLLELANSLTLADTNNLLPLNSAFMWIKDLSQPERLVLDFIPSTLPIIGAGIPVLAIIVFISSYWQSKVMTPTSTNPNDPNASMGKMMSIYIPVLMGWLSYSFSAGLALYFVTSNFAQIIQYILMGRINIPGFSKADAA